VNALVALADPTRRRIVELLAEGERSAGDLAAQFETSRPGVSRHLRVLREQGLVRARGDGARRLYSLDPAPLAELDDWLARYRGFWTNRLDALDTEISRRARRRANTDPEMVDSDFRTHGNSQSTIKEDR
jgi:DNA-binding transcriptional ArsR family regulator